MSSLFDPQRTQATTSFTWQKSMATPHSTSRSTYTSIQMSVHAHTHSYVPWQRVSQWETGTNCSGRGKCLCSERKSNCLARNKAKGHASMCRVMVTHTQIHKYMQQAIAEKKLMPGFRVELSVYMLFYYPEKWKEALLKLSWFTKYSHPCCNVYSCYYIDVPGVVVERARSWK